MSEAAFFEAYSGARQRAMDLIAGRLHGGLIVVIGTPGYLDLGTAVGSSGGLRVLIKRRATRDEYLAASPHGAMAAAELSTPFYWELEMERPS